jgi:aarF domain-containing kinase
LNLAVQLAEYIFHNEQFSFRWLAEEMAPNLPKELNFYHEGQNAERAATFFNTWKNPSLSCVIPKVHWDKTSERILTMDFEEGCKITDIDRLHEMGFTPKDHSHITKLVSSIFAAQVFLSGFVHCDPHPANVLIRRDQSNGRPIIVLVDHGLYKSIDTDFRLKYAQLWKSIMLANVDDIIQACYDLGMPKSNPVTNENDGSNNNSSTQQSHRNSSSSRSSDDACRLFAGVITARPFDEVIERSNQKKQQQSFWIRSWFLQKPKSQPSSNSNDTKSDQAIIRGYAQRFLPNIVAMLSILPRPVLLLLKMNDCLRHIDYTLGGSPTNTMIVNGHYAAYALYLNELQQQQQQQQQQSPSSSLSLWSHRFQAWWEYMKISTRIHINEMILWWMQRFESIVHL